MCWTTSCVTSARVHVVEASLHHSFAPVSPASSTTASTAGCRSTRGQAASITSRLSRKVPTDLGRCHSAGAETSGSFGSAPFGRQHVRRVCLSTFVFFRVFKRFLSIFIAQKLNILCCLAFRWPIQRLFIQRMQLFLKSSYS